MRWNGATRLVACAAVIVWSLTACSDAVESEGGTTDQGTQAASDATISNPEQAQGDGAVSDQDAGPDASTEDDSDAVGNDNDAESDLSDVAPEDVTESTLDDIDQGEPGSDAADDTSTSVDEGLDIMESPEVQAPADDMDMDNIPDEHDNCPQTPNTNQEDEDGDGVGDACEADTDGDGMADDYDLYSDDPDMPGEADPGLIYAHTKNTLFSFDPDSYAITELGLFTWADGTSEYITDIAIDSHGRLYATGFGSLHICHPETVQCILLAALPSGYSFNGLTFVPAQGTDDDEEELIAIAQDGSWVRLDNQDGVIVSTELGDYGYTSTGEEYGSSGDAYSINGLGTFAAVRHGLIDVGQEDVLVQVDPVTGEVLTEIETIGNYGGIFGLGGWSTRAYAFDSSGVVLRIEIMSAAVTIVAETDHTWWGAGVRTDAQ